MNGREMSRQTSAKQTNAQTQHNRTKILMVGSVDRAAKGSLSKNDNRAYDNVD